MRKILLFALFISLSISSFSQNESSWWIFGDVAGIEFTPNPQNRSTSAPVVTSLYGQEEGVASVADANGNLLFFTNGRTVFNRNGVVMPNGNGLFGNDSSTQSAIIVKAPETPNVYFIFTVGASGGGPLAYSRVEMNLNGGLGDVVPGVKNIVLLESCAEKVAATIKTGSNNAYVMTFAESNATNTSNGIGDFNALFVWEVRGIPGAGISFVNPAPVNQVANGNQRFFNTPVASTTGDRGMLRISPDGTKLVIATQNLTNQGVTLYDFNPGTGQFSGAGLKLDNGPAYGVEFSPSSQYLYHDLSDAYSPSASSNRRFIQYNLCDPANILSSKNQFASITGESRGTLQLAQDGNIYVARYGATALGMIEPETATPVYVPNAVSIAPGISRQGLPVFIQSKFSTSFTVNDQCQGSATEFILACLPQVAASNWDFGDGNTLSVTGPGVVTNTYAAAGDYTVNVNVTNVSGDTRSFSQVIRIFENGIVDPIDNTLLDYCDADGSGSEVVDLTTFTSDVLGAQDPNTFRISYYQNQLDADAGTNPVNTNYNLPLGTNTVWVRIENLTSPVNDGCSSIAPISITISTIPTVINLPDLEACDDSSLDGTEVFNLQAYLTIIENTAGNPVDVSYTLYNNLADANMDMNAIDPTIPFTNTSSPQVLYVRLQNTNDADCFSTTPFNVVVFSKPVITTPVDITVCDDAPLDGSTNFTLTDQDATVLGSTVGTVTYHHSQMDADTGNQPLASPYTVTGTQTVYVRLESDSGCFNTTSFDITVDVAPAIGNAPDLTNICDGNSDLNQNVFDLSTQDIAILNGLNSSDYTITYYTADADAQNGSNPLPTNYTVPFQANVSTDLLFARIENNATGCFNTSQFTIIFERCEILFPEGFSPNNDGVNDTFSIPGLVEQYPNFELQIFNRLGKVIYTTRASNYVEFDGKPDNGDGLLPVGTYFYVIKYNDLDKKDTASWVYINY